MQDYQPKFLQTRATGRLREKIDAAAEIIADCTMCPRLCHVNRPGEELGVCRTGSRAWVSAYSPHFGEESPLVGRGGSGTIFFTHCSLCCIFCQNYEISQEADGKPVSSEQLADMMTALQDAGCHNINFVTPSHVVAQILAALEIAAGNGLRLPLVYNTSGYDRVETLQLLDGIIDLYMPDFKFWDPTVAEAVCRAPDYPETARNAVREMHRQVGDLIVDDDGIARSGLLLRHLVMPDGIAGTRDIMRFVAQEISSETYVNVMPQYRPCGRAGELEATAKSISREDYRLALEATRQEGIHRLDQRRPTFLAW